MQKTKLGTRETVVGFLRNKWPSNMLSVRGTAGSPHSAANEVGKDTAGLCGTFLSLWMRQHL